VELNVKDYDEDLLHSLYSLSSVAKYTTGFFLASVRLIDPFYRFSIKSNIFTWFGKIIKKPSKGIQAKPLNSYLAASLNCELINIIL
jgi:hypothetical protein